MTIENGRISPEQVTLPERYEEATLASLLPGESSYVTPWTMWFDMEGKGWIALASIPRDKPCGTVEMWVARAEEGFIVDISYLVAQWTKQARPSGVGHSEGDFAPVIGLVTNPHEKEIALSYLQSIS